MSESQLKPKYFVSILGTSSVWHLVASLAAVPLVFLIAPVSPALAMAVAFVPVAAGLIGLARGWMNADQQGKELKALEQRVAQAEAGIAPDMARTPTRHDFAERIQAERAQASTHER